jgi:hypothetical protein
MASEEAGDPVKRERVNVKRKRLDGIRKLTCVFSGLRFMFHVLRRKYDDR